VSFHDKLLTLEDLPAWCAARRRLGRRLVATNGCFDLLHLGHATYLEAARAQGDVLLVGVNGDASVRALKGASRPVNAEADRALLVAALASVDAVCVFPEASAAEFLRRAQPDVWAKGGDYTLETLNQTERQVVEETGGRIAFIPFVPGKSTTALLQRSRGD
jgi:rfaE bifunctional protein nucleotidyltransferase chain/domain